METTHVDFSVTAWSVDSAQYTLLALSIIITVIVIHYVGTALCSGRI